MKEKEFTNFFKQMKKDETKSDLQETKKVEDEDIKPEQTELVHEKNLWSFSPLPR
jgi:hypothetical protein